METLVPIIERVVEAGEWFVRTPSLRVLHISVSEMTRIPVLQHLTASEMLDANASPFFVLEAPVEENDAGWELRAEELRADWQELGKDAARPPAALWAPKSSSSAIQRFALELHAALDRATDGMRGLVIVLAPVWIKDAKQWQRDLDVLLSQRLLDGARFVLVEPDADHSGELRERLGSAAESIDARPDEAALRAELAAQLSEARAAAPGADASHLAGGAAPAVQPPPRVKQPAAPGPAERGEQARALGLAPATFDPQFAQRLRVLVLSAASAMSTGAIGDALKLQREAIDLCLSNGLAREAIVNELILGGYGLQAGARESALEVFRAARQRADSVSAPQLAVQASLAEASTLLLLKRVDDAIRMYSSTGALAVASGATVFAIEAYRTAGQLLLSQGMTELAARTFRNAIDAAGTLDADAQRATSAPEAARALAALCRRHNLVAQAESLEAQATAIENAPVATPPSDRKPN